MAIFFAAHLIEDRGRCRVIDLESFGEVAVDAGIFFFEGDGQCQYLLLVEALKGSHGSACADSRPAPYPGPPSAAPNHWGFLAVPSNPLVVLNPSKRPCEAGAAVRVSSADICAAESGR